MIVFIRVRICGHNIKLKSGNYEKRNICNSFICDCTLLTLIHQAQAEVSWGDFNVPREAKVLIDDELTNTCPIMMNQEVFIVVASSKRLESEDHAVYTVERKGRGYSSGDPDHHFIFEINENSINHTPQSYDIAEFNILAECR